MPEIKRLDRLPVQTMPLCGGVARMCATTSIHATAKWHGLDWKTVKALDFRHLMQTLGPVDLSDVRVIAMDEFAIQKGHRYATVVVEPSRKRVLWVGRGRSRADIRPFFELL
ncbi:MAG: transposase, partial [Rhodococcus sp. (in: high G+C Gram-positive bacteria)]|uniref:transposase n=1 Tax=Rhodococcus sp. TaxID=1831 RepID=UPI0033155221